MDNPSGRAEPNLWLGSMFISLGIFAAIRPEQQSPGSDAWFSSNLCGAQGV
jgi:hypothetical protein